MRPIALSFAIALLFLSACKNEQVDQATQVAPPKYPCIPKTMDADWYGSDQKAPLFEGLDAIHYPITTEDELVQRYFDQGLCLAFGFNHAEAARSFHYATKLDPNCAMAYWGFAYVLGPNYNAGMEPDNYERAYAAIERAQENSSSASPREQALITALAKRYVAIPPEDRADLDASYSEAMGEVFASYPDDATVGAIYAESMMDMHPWDLWNKERDAQPWTPKILETIEQVLVLDDKHIGAHHLYIHAVEASKKPERALRSADLFHDGLVKGSGHLVHMPSHIYLRTGQYHKGTVANINAVNVDSAYFESCHAQGSYPLAYYPHNYHFMAATAALEGNGKWAIFAAEKVREKTETALMTTPGWTTLQHYYSIPYNTYVKFGKWDQILSMELEHDTLPYPRAIQHYARGMAYASKGELELAKQELSGLEIHGSASSIEEMYIWGLNPASDLIAIAIDVLKSELALAEGNAGAAVRLLEHALDIENALLYNEPPDWISPVRHRLGRAYIEMEAYDSAIQNYQQDLIRFPKNGWAINGIVLAQERIGNEEEAALFREQLKQVWANADIVLNGSVIP